MSDDALAPPTAGPHTGSDESGAESGIELVLITGMSSAGRSTAANVLEDLGWYVVDNLPPQLLPPMIALTASAPQHGRRLAAVIDARSRAFFEALQDALVELGGQGVEPRVVFLDASDDVLVRRQESVRRPHPLQGGGRILDGIRRERELLSQVRESADLLVDTSGLNVTQLKTKVTQAFDRADGVRLRATLMSFGFKYGIPLDADFVIDMRFLPNPFWVPALRPHSGLSDEVRDYVMSQDGATVFLDRFVSSLEPVLAGYLAEGKRYMTIAVGCTGGKHRSVSITRALAERLEGLGVQIGVLHRDLGRE